MVRKHVANIANVKYKGTGSDRTLLRIGRRNSEAYSKKREIVLCRTDGTRRAFPGSQFKLTSCKMTSCVTRKDVASNNQHKQRKLYPIYGKHTCGHRMHRQTAHEVL